MNAHDRQAFVFRFFSLAFSFPDQACLRELKKAARKTGGERNAFAELSACFSSEDAECLQSEYTRLFISGYPNTPCPPYESVYREKRMLGDAAAAVQARYREWDMTVETGLTDHIATEFEFLAFLALAASLEHSREAAGNDSERFFNEHLCRWVPGFCTDLERAALLDPYRKLAGLLRESLGMCGKA